MRNKRVIVLFTALVMGLLCIGTIYAQSIRTGLYSDTAGNGVRIQINAGNGLLVIHPSNRDTVLGRGTYTIRGNSIVLNFGQISGAGSYLSSKAWTYSLDGDDGFSGNGQFWVRVAN